MRITLMVFLVIAIAACNNIKSKDDSSTGSIPLNTDSNITSLPTVKTDFTADSVITVNFPKDSSSVTVIGKIRGIDHPVTVNVSIKKGKELTVVLTPEDSVANIRINQVFTPDGKADGPFGRTLNKKVSQQGNYKLLIGENQMQGDEWKGKFKLMVKVE